MLPAVGGCCSCPVATRRPKLFNATTPPTLWVPAGWLAGCCSPGCSAMVVRCGAVVVRCGAVWCAGALQLGCCEGGSMQQGVPCPTRPAQPRSQAATCPRLGLAGRHQTTPCRRVWASKAQGSGLACLPAAFDAGALE